MNDTHGMKPNMASPAPPFDSSQRITNSVRTRLVYLRYQTDLVTLRLVSSGWTTNYPDTLNSHTASITRIKKLMVTIATSWQTQNLSPAVFTVRGWYRRFLTEGKPLPQHVLWRPSIGQGQQHALNTLGKAQSQECTRQCGRLVLQMMRPRVSM